MAKVSGIPTSFTIDDSVGAPQTFSNQVGTVSLNLSRAQQDVSGLERTRPDMEKFERQIPEQYWDQPAPLHRIYMLNPNNKNELKLVPVQSINTFRLVLQNTYRQQFLDGLAMRAPHFTLVSAVAKHTKVIRALRPSGQFKLIELADMIEQDFGQD